VPSVAVGAARRLAAVAAVVGPGVLAGLSDDDPAGITTYSILGADHGYRLLWVLALSVAALALFHELAVRVGVVTGQGLAGIIRDRFGVRIAAAGVAALVPANLGTTCAEFAGIAAAMELFGVARQISVPLAALAVGALIVRGRFARVEHLLLALSTVFVAYVVAGILAQPDWGAALDGLVVPSVPGGRDVVLVIAATVGTTLAPWGLAFIQSYAVDKRLTPGDLRYERVDVIVGAVMTGTIGALVVVACAATLHRQGRSVDDARDAAAALEPLAGGLAATLFGAGLLGAGLLGAAVVPLSTAYSLSEAIGVEAALDDPIAEAPIFYGSFVGVIVVSAAVVLVPAVPLVPILFLTQALNAVLLLLVLIHVIARDRRLMGAHAMRPAASVASAVATALIAACVGGLLLFST
jgi:NRAMP (natural resistance-associated macrophage protein)-like metal ion transporter